LYAGDWVKRAGTGGRSIGTAKKGCVPASARGATEGGGATGGGNLGILFLLVWGFPLLKSLREDPGGLGCSGLAEEETKG